MNLRTFGLSTLLGALCATGLSGCIIVDGTGSCNLGACTTRPGSGYLVAPIAVGVGAPQPNYAGYVITANVGSYRITWGGFREFRGSVWIKSGTPQFTPGCVDGSCSLAGGEDRVVIGSEAGRIDFISYPGSGKRSGFDLTFTGDLVLDLLVDDIRDPSRVGFVSGVNGQFSSAPSMPFGLTM